MESVWRYYGECMEILWRVYGDTMVTLADNKWAGSVAVGGGEGDAARPLLGVAGKVGGGRGNFGAGGGGLSGTNGSNCLISTLIRHTNSTQFE